MSVYRDVLIDRPETQSLRSGIVLLQSQSEGLEEPFGCHYIVKEMHHEISAHFRWHQKHQYP
jgi:hypothetical protein